ncbi:unnamed protein product, partial [Prorocentrum cordatum]
GALGGAGAAGAGAAEGAASKGRGSQGAAPAGAGPASAAPAEAAPASAAPAGAADAPSTPEDDGTEGAAAQAPAPAGGGGAEAAVAEVRTQASAFGVEVVGGLQWRPGDEVTVRWEKLGGENNLATVQLYREDFWQPIAQGLVPLSSGSVAVLIPPDAAEGRYYIVLQGRSDAAAYAHSPRFAVGPAAAEERHIALRPASARLPSLSRGSALLPPLPKARFEKPPCQIATASSDLMAPALTIHEAKEMHSSVRRGWALSLAFDVGMSVQGFPEQVRLPKTGRVLPVNFEKILQHLKKTFKTNGTLIKDEEHGTIIQLQGDIRKEVAEFLIEATALISKDQVMIHGS